MTPGDVLSELHRRGIRLRLAVEYAPEDGVDEELRAHMAQHRDALIQAIALSTEQADAFRGSSDDLARESGWF